MKKSLITSLFFLTTVFCNAQIEFDLSNFTESTESISLDFKKTIVIKNLCLDPTYSYSYKIGVTTTETPMFNAAGLAGAACASRVADANNQTYQTEKSNLLIEKDEKKIDALVQKILAAIKNLNPALDQGCIDEGNELVKATRIENKIFLDLKPNQVITVVVTRISNTAGSKPVTWTKTYKTPEKTRWLVHYGLTYAPQLISKVDHFHSLADTTTANRYTITKDNKNGPNRWDNISATINFTYSFHENPKGFDGGFTAGFGISTGLGLSGHAGLSAIIGENVIISSGVALMQKYKLKGDYKEGQIIKENLSSDALHEKVWLPEIYFTIGFRFGSNPFAPKTTTGSNTASTNN